MADYIALMAINSSIEGMTQGQIFKKFGSIMPWIYQNTQNQNLRV